MRIRRIPAATAVLVAVVFLLISLAAGCRGASSGPDGAEGRPTRRKAADYSRIPANYPAAWQTSVGGH